jgi:hypothetical protein
MSIELRKYSYLDTKTMRNAFEKLISRSDHYTGAEEYIQMVCSTT